MVAAAVSSYGGLTVLYNNAGVMLADDGSVHSTDESIWDTTLGVNVKGVAHGCKYGIPAMIESGGGSVINVASFVAWMGAATPQTAYTASKGAVLAMTREMAVVTREGDPLQRPLPRAHRHATAHGAAVRSRPPPAAVRPYPMGRPVRGRARKAALCLASDDSST